MINLILLWETFTNSFRAEMLDVASLFAIFCAILVIVSKNPIVSALFLIGLFLSISCYLIMLGINFIGLSYLLVYVGAVSILFLFILMLINVRISELLTDTSNSIPLAIIISISFYSSVHSTIPYSIVPFTSYISNIINTFNDILDIILLYINNDGNLSETSHITSIGNILYTTYSIWLILTSVILLLAMVGAIVITIKQREVKREVKSMNT
ncbi:NADH dehydrogenase subunit 6 (mitochondrion) [Sclerotinia sclerotiorum 1980 UF-70]|uniref:NADH-ubiquinone oxidoreductase chain 6 n=1 Tax=Sclerotinia sclerotiorum (strain ATCC 18683 / 1980 / Ss-1) TaxID=665079 RepID=A0A0K0PSW5_SCLS1|nr:NADH dehydrogenase subunit 6 [Sclerotinia sclerotiorum 1980 UF-70]AKQ53301.1 NADH dehydrogenase subunit 6 [Sclerotinia sclerotiorum 1980 UF-70]